MSIPHRHSIRRVCIRYPKTRLVRFKGRNMIENTAGDVVNGRMEGRKPGRGHGIGMTSGKRDRRWESDNWRGDSSEDCFCYETE